MEGFQFRLRLNFDNRDYLAGRRYSSGSGLNLERLSLTNGQADSHYKGLTQLSSSILLQLFPFTLVFRPDLEIINVGCQLKQMYPNGALLKMTLPEVARLRRPKLRMTWDNVIHHNQDFQNHKNYSSFLPCSFTVSRKFCARLSFCRRIGKQLKILRR